MKRIIVLIGAILFHPAYSQDLIDNIDKYHQNSKWQKSTAMSHFEDFAKHEALKGKESLLDVCSGDGKISALIANMLPNGTVIGVDNSDKMVAFSTQHYGLTVPNVSFKSMDVTNIHFNQKFDVVTSFTCMHLIPNQKTVLRGMHDSLKENGKLLMIFPISHGFQQSLHKVTTTKKWKNYFANFQPNWTFFEPDTYKGYLTEAGFNPKSVEVFRQDEIYTDRDEFTDSISHWLPHLKVLPQNLQKVFLKDLVRIYLSEVPPTSNGQIHFYVDNLMVVANR